MLVTDPLLKSALRAPALQNMYSSNAVVLIAATSCSI